MSTAAWVGPTVAISLVIIAASFLVMGAIAVGLALGARRQSAALKQSIAAFAGDARAMTARLRGELEGYASLSADARGRLKGAMERVDGRLRDLDALVEVLQEEAEETALDAAAFLRTVRRTGGILGTARRALRARRRHRD